MNLMNLKKLSIVDVEKSNILIIGEDEEHTKIIINDILNMLIDNDRVDGKVISTTPNEFANIVGEENVYSKYEEQNIEPNTFLVLHDCKPYIKDMNKSMIHDILLNGRHVKIEFVFTMKYPTNIPVSMRMNFDFVFILHSNALDDRQKIYTDYAGIFPTFEQFEQTFANISDDQCMVIKNRMNRREMTDTVFDKILYYDIVKPGPQISRLSLSSVSNSNILIIGKDYETPKSIIKNILLGVKGKIVSPDKQYFANIVGEENVYSTFSSKIVEDLLIKDDNNFLVLHDCMSSISSSNNSILKSVANSEKVLPFILTLQYPMGVGPSIRTHFDYIFLLNEETLSSRQKLWTIYCNNIFPTFLSFNQIFKKIINEHTCMVIEKDSGNVFYYDI
jgi:hypothetical protein